MGRKTQSKRRWILKDATLDYRESDIKRFIKMWNEGFHIGDIAYLLNVKINDIYLLIIELNETGEIVPRTNGMAGTKERIYSEK
jgi:hypothetical protein